MEFLFKLILPETYFLPDLSNLAKLGLGKLSVKDLTNVLYFVDPRVTDTGTQLCP